MPSSAVDIADLPFPVVDVATHGLPALVLGVRTGRRYETATDEFTRSQLERAVEMLAPAEAAELYQHPNINAWRAIPGRCSVEPDAQVSGVFLATLDEPVSSPTTRRCVIRSLPA